MRQLPGGNEIFLDHVGHFIADVEAARKALAALGFASTPPSVQTNPDPQGGPPLPTGTGNTCLMLREGYIELLYRTADTPLAREFDQARARYSGLHLAAMAVADAGATYRRLEAAGIPLRPPVDLRREVDLENGRATARFSVVRPAPGAMPEGRIQYLTHHTEAAVWQGRWLDHPNGVTGLIDLAMVVDDLEAAAARYARFLGRPAQGDGDRRWIDLDRGAIVLLSPADAARRLPEARPPALPFIAGYGLRVRDLAAVAGHLDQAGLPVRRHGEAIVSPFPPALGEGLWAFVEGTAQTPWRA